MHPVHTLPLYFPNIHCNIIFPSVPRSSKWSLPFRSSECKANAPNYTEGQLFCRYLKIKIIENYVNIWSVSWLLTHRFLDVFHSLSCVPISIFWAAKIKTKLLLHHAVVLSIIIRVVLNGEDSSKLGLRNNTQAMLSQLLSFVSKWLSWFVSHRYVDCLSFHFALDIQRPVRMLRTEHFKSFPPTTSGSKHILNYKFSFFVQQLTNIYSTIQIEVFWVVVMW